jgi:hypothetical protein
MFPKNKKIVSKAVRNAARGEPCTVRIPGICNQNPETSVWAHLPHDSKGMAQKSVDICGVISCMACHDFIDFRAKKGIQFRDNPDDEIWLQKRLRTAMVDSLLVLMDKEVLLIA